MSLAGQTDMEEWSSSSVAGGLVTLNGGAGWLQVLRPGRIKLTCPGAMKCHLYWATTSLLAARVFPVEK